MIDILTFPFMQRALAAGLMSAVLLGWIGVYVVSRHMSFMGDGIAHASLAGVALALLVGWSPLPLALLVGVVMAILIFILEKRTTISTDAAIGILFTSGLAIGVVLMNFHSGYQPELISYLFGNILAVRTIDLVIMGIVGFFVVLFLGVWRRQITFMTVDPEGAYLHGLSGWRYDLALYIMTALSIVLSIKLLGIVLVSALLIIPSSIAKLFSHSFRSFLIYTIIISVSVVFFGLLISYFLDIPSGATIVLFGALVFGASAILHVIKKHV